MHTTITQNGALYAAHHKPARAAKAPAKHVNARTVDYVVPTLRTSVGKFALRPARLGVHLEIVVGQVSRLLGLYNSRDAALHALKDRKTGFSTWDQLARRTAADQIAETERWGEGA